MAEYSIPSDSRTFRETLFSNDQRPARGNPEPMLSESPINYAQANEREGLVEDSESFARHWQHVLTGFKAKDDAMLKDFNEEIDTLLVFAGLFSAVLTAFIIDVYKRLEEDPADASAAILRRISIQLAGAADEQLDPLPSSSFHPSRLVIAVNVLWFASLLFSLFAALVGILAKQ